MPEKTKKEKAKPSSMVTWLVVMPYLISQVVTWLYVFICLWPDEGQPFMELNSWRFDQYWREGMHFDWWLKVAQSLQLLDVLFALFGITQNSLPTVFAQIASRYVILYVMLPHVEKGHYSIFLACMCWSITEVTRFTFYALKNSGMDMGTNLLASIVGHARYNTFIILYPLGVTGELLCCFKTWQYLASLPEGSPKPFTIHMPNALNIAFDLERVIQFVVPLAYFFGFPPLYSHMWVQRRKHYQSMRAAYSRASLVVPEKFKTFLPVRNLQKLQFAPGKPRNPMVIPHETIEHKEGDVMLIDFWATWCPPCQQPMAHNQEMMAKYGATQWQDKQTGRSVRIIGLSLDQSVTEMQAHVVKMGWVSVENYIVTDQKPGQQYEIAGIPHVMLVDKQGKVVFKGHPAHRTDLAADLSRLWQGLPLE